MDIDHWTLDSHKYSFVYHIYHKGWLVNPELPEAKFRPDGQLGHHGTQYTKTSFYSNRTE